MGKLAILKNDKFKFSKGNGMYLNPYTGNGMYLNPYQPNKNENSDGGSLDFSALTNLVSTGTNFLKDHADTIKNVSSTVGNVANASNSIANAVKASKDLDKLKEIKELQNKRVEERLKKQSKKLPDSVLQKILTPPKQGEGLKYV